MKAQIRGSRNAVYYLAVAISVLSVVLIAAGALVTSTGSGDAIPDWPTSYSSLVPAQLAGGVLIEWVHRAIAGVLVLLVATLTLLLALSDQPKAVKILGAVVFFSVLAQAVLGGLRVLVVSNEKVQKATLTVFGLPEPEVGRIAFGVAHAILAQIVLGFAVAIALLTKPHNRSQLQTKPSSTVVFISGLVVGLIVVQLIIGAIMRHTNSGLIIPDFPTSFGKLFPPFGNLPFDAGNHGIMTYNEFAFRVAVNFAHRLNGFLIALAVVSLFCMVSRIPSLKGSPLHSLAMVQLGLTLLQVFLGGLTVWSELSVPVTVAHVSIGAILMAISTLVFLLSLLPERSRLIGIKPE